MAAAASPPNSTAGVAPDGAIAVAVGSAASDPGGLFGAPGAPSNAPVGVHMTGGAGLQIMPSGFPLGAPPGMPSGMIPAAGMMQPGMLPPGMVPGVVSAPPGGGLPPGGCGYDRDFACDYPGIAPGMHPSMVGMHHHMGAWLSGGAMPGWPVQAKNKKDKKEKEREKEKEKTEKKRARKKSASSRSSSQRSSSSRSRRRKKRRKDKDKGKGKDKDKKKRKRSESRHSTPGDGHGDGCSVAPSQPADDVRAAAARLAVAGAVAAVAGRERAAAAAATGRRMAAGRSQSQESSTPRSAPQSPRRAEAPDTPARPGEVGFSQQQLHSQQHSHQQQLQQQQQQQQQQRQQEDVSGWVAAGMQAMGFKRPERIDVLPLPRDVIGRIIGKAGATIKEIRERSGARVDARDQTEDPVQVLISGTNEAVAMAKAMLLDAAEGAQSAKYAVPDVRANAEDSISKAKAQAAAAAAAVSAAAAVVGGMVSGGSPQPASPTGQAPGSSVALVSGGKPLVEEHLELPKHATGKVIGTRGQQIAEIRQRSGAQVDVDKSATGCRVRLVGTQDQIEAAKVLVGQLMGPPGQEGGGEYLEIPKSAVGRVIGAGGSRIQELQERSGAKIDIDRTGERCIVRFSGFPDNVAAAKSMVAEVLEGRDRSVLGECLATLEVPSTCTGRLIGPGGKQINDIQNASGAKVDIDKGREPCIVRMTGTQDAVTKAEAMVREVIQTIPPAALLGRPNIPPPPMGMPPPGAAGLHAAVAARLNSLGMTNTAPSAALDEESIRFDIQLSVLEKLLSNENGSWIRNVSNRTGARIQVKKDFTGKYYLEINGQPEQAVEAESLAEDAVRMLSAAAIADAADAVAAGGLAAPGPSGLPCAPGGIAPGAMTLRRPPAARFPGSAHFGGVPGASRLARGPLQPATTISVGSMSAALGARLGKFPVQQPRPELPQQPAPESQTSTGPALGIVTTAMRPTAPIFVSGPSSAPIPDPRLAPRPTLEPASSSTAGQSRAVDPSLAACLAPGQPAAGPATGPALGPPPAGSAFAPAPMGWTSPTPPPFAFMGVPPPPWANPANSQPPPPWATPPHFHPPPPMQPLPLQSTPMHPMPPPGAASSAMQIHPPAWGVVPQS